MDKSGDRIKAIRERFGHSQKEMADKLGVSVGTYQTYEYGGQLPKPSCLRTLIQDGFDANWLLNGIGQMRRLSEADIKKLEENIERMSREGITRSDFIKEASGIAESYVDRSLLGSIMGGYLRFLGEKNAVSTVQEIYDFHDEWLDYLKSKKAEGVDEAEIYMMLIEKLGQKIRSE